MRCVACFTVSLCVVSIIIGCGGGSGGGADGMSTSGGEQPAPMVESMAEAMDVDAEEFSGSSNETVLPEAVDESEIGEDGNLKPNDGEPEQIRRQIIHTAQLNLVVEEFDGVPEQVEQLASHHDGFVANSSLQGSSGSPRSGSWTIRVPVRQYGTFLDAIQAIGEFQSLTTGSREVTAEYYDVQARIKNKQRQEERLLELLEKRTGKLQDVLQVEEQLARVREAVERMQGRMRVLKDLTAFSTITLTVNEIKGYKPPAAPTFGNRIARAWGGTLEALLSTGQNLVIGIVSVGPWLAVLSIPVIIFIGLIRLLLRKRVTR